MNVTPNDLDSYELHALRGLAGGRTNFVTNDSLQRFINLGLVELVADGSAALTDDGKRVMSEARHLGR